MEGNLVKARSRTKPFSFRRWTYFHTPATLRSEWWFCTGTNRELTVGSVLSSSFVFDSAVVVQVRTDYVCTAAGSIPRQMVRLVRERSLAHRWWRFRWWLQRYVRSPVGPGRSTAFEWSWVILDRLQILEYARKTWKVGGPRRWISLKWCSNFMHHVRVGRFEVRWITKKWR